METQIEPPKMGQNISKIQMQDIVNVQNHEGINPKLKISHRELQEYMANDKSQEIVSGICDETVKYEKVSELSNLRKNENHCVNLEISEKELQEFAIFKEEQILNQQNQEYVNVVSKDGVNEGYMEQNMKCNLCLENFKLKKKLKQHMKIAHDGTNGFKCNICQTKFLKKRYLKEHVSFIHEGKKRSSECKICHLTLSDESSLNVKHVTLIL